MDYLLITKLMAKDSLPLEYQEFPANFLYAFFSLMILQVKSEKQFFCSHKKPFYEMHEYSGKQSTVLIFQKEGNIYSLKIYLQEHSRPDFEKNYGFDEVYSSKNLFIATFDSSNRIEPKINVRLSSDVEKGLSLDPFKMDREPSYPFQGSSKFAVLFWKSYKHIMEKQFSQMSIH